MARQKKAKLFTVLPGPIHIPDDYPAAAIPEVPVRKVEVRMAKDGQVQLMLEYRREDFPVDYPDDLPVRFTFTHEQLEKIVEFAKQIGN